jgi:hypothetical protein
MSFKEPDEEKALQEFKYLYGYSNIFPFNLFHSYDDKQNNLLRYCVRTNNPDCVQKLLPYVDPSRPGNEALKLACENNFYVIVSILLQDGRSDPASYRDDNYCIRIASEKASQIQSLYFLRMVVLIQIKVLKLLANKDTSKLSNSY